MKHFIKIAGLGIFTAIGSSLCCIVPLIALLAGSSSAASSMTWVEPIRPYLIWVTVFVLSISWFLHLRPVKKDDCGCEEKLKKPFMQSRSFLIIITLFAGLMSAFPYYSGAFYNNDLQSNIVTDSNLQTMTSEVKGMTCQACEYHVNLAVNELEGVASVLTSYEKGKTEVKYDITLTSRQEILNAIESTGYRAKEINP